MKVNAEKGTFSSKQWQKSQIKIRQGRIVSIGNLIGTTLVPLTPVLLSVEQAQLRYCTCANKTLKFESLRVKKKRLGNYIPPTKKRLISTCICHNYIKIFFCIFHYLPPMQIQDCFSYITLYEILSSWCDYIFYTKDNTIKGQGTT